jgi:L-cysteine desulfidase
VRKLRLEEALDILRREVRPALGCTEPAAVALACAYAAKELEGEITRVEVRVDPNVYKNGMGVYVPGTKTTGLNVAAALGAIIGQPDLELEVLQALTEDVLKKALQLMELKAVTVVPEGDFGALKIVAKVVTRDAVAEATIMGSHTNLTHLALNDRELFAKTSCQVAGADLGWLMSLTVRGIVEGVRGGGSEFDFLVDLAEQNRGVAREGVSRPLGVGLGYSCHNLIEQGRLGNDMANRAMSLTAAAADVRMSGQPNTVISTNGSGNQGLTASIPLTVVGDACASTRAKLAEALAISHLLTIYVKLHIGKLSASCACSMAAAIGASCASAYLMDCTMEQIEDCISIMAANLTGMICDGAKVSCSFKLATAVCTAVQTALLVTTGVRAPASDGILALTPEETIRNLGAVSNPGMRETDKVILDLMCTKSSQ